MALTISEQQALCAELLAQDSVLLLQILDDVLSTAIHPSGENLDQILKLQRVDRAERGSRGVPKTGREPRR